MDPGGAPGFGASESSRLLDGSRGSSSALPPIVRRLGWVAFFTDAAGDMIYPLLPAFLVSLGAGAGALGWVEGIAEATSALVKVWSGRVSDRDDRSSDARARYGALARRPRTGDRQARQGASCPVA